MYHLIAFLLLFLHTSNYTVDIIAPSCKGKHSDLVNIIEYIKSLNLNTSLSEKIYNDNNPFYSNSDKFRANDLIKAITSDSKIIWAIKGGKGASRLIPYLEHLTISQKEKIAKNKKILIGYSDITALHIYLHTKYDWQTIHGTMLNMIVNDLVSKDSIKKLEMLISNQLSSVTFDDLKLINKSQIKYLKSKVVGGNMTLIENSIGTSWQINTNNKIMFLEDIKVPPYALERSLDHLKQANIFEGVNAVIFGDFIDSGNDNLLEVVKKRFADSVDFPIFTMQGVGHGYVNDPLPLNTEATISAKSDRENLFCMNVKNAYH